VWWRMLVPAAALNAPDRFVFDFLGTIGVGESLAKIDRISFYRKARHLCED